MFSFFGRRGRGNSGNRNVLGVPYVIGISLVDTKVALLWFSALLVSSSHQALYHFWFYPFASHVFYWFHHWGLSRLSSAVAVVLYIVFLEIGWVFDSVINLTDLPLALELWFSL